MTRWNVIADAITFLQLIRASRPIGTRDAARVSNIKRAGLAMQTIRPAIESDADLLPEIERSSGETFCQIPALAWIADDDVQTADRHRVLISRGSSWVATVDRDVFGFLSAERHGEMLHIWQMAVHFEHQGKGLGRALIDAARQWAKARSLSSLTLTTFRDVPWNAPFYESCGFALVAPDSSPFLKNVLEAEKKAGLPIEARCAMMLKL